MGVFQSERFALKLHRTQTNNYGLTKKQATTQSSKTTFIGVTS